jgi:hypothetical protein
LLVRCFHMFNHNDVNNTPGKHGAAMNDPKNLLGSTEMGRVHLDQ